MTFKDWMFSKTPDGFEVKSLPWAGYISWHWLAIAIVVAISLFFRNKSEKTKWIVLIVIASTLISFEVTRRIINLINNNYILESGHIDWHHVFYILLPRPWYALGCWTLMISPFINRKSFYNYTAMVCLLPAIVFFAYPEAGFKNIIRFEEVYSITTHTLLLIGSILVMTLGKTDFRYKRSKEPVWIEILLITLLFSYGIFLIIADIEKDPLFFMPGNDVMEIVGIKYSIYLVIYVVFVFGLWNNSYYLINYLRLKNKETKTLKQKDLSS